MTTGTTYDLCRAHLDRLVTVSDNEMAAACALLFRDVNIAAEPAIIFTNYEPTPYFIDSCDPVFIAAGVSGVLGWRKSQESTVIVEWETASELDTVGFTYTGLNLQPNLTSKLTKR